MLIDIMNDSGMMDIKWWQGITLSDNTWWLIPILILFLGSIMVTMILALIRYKQPRKTIVKDYANVLLALGGVQNINKVTLDGSRITLAISERSRCNFQALKALGATGVFVSGDMIKIMWPKEAQALTHYLEKAIQEQKS